MFALTQSWPELDLLHGGSHVCAPCLRTTAYHRLQPTQQNTALQALPATPHQRLPGIAGGGAEAHSWLLRGDAHSVLRTHTRGIWVGVSAFKVFLTAYCLISTEQSRMHKPAASVKPDNAG